MIRIKVHTQLFTDGMIKMRSGMLHGAYAGMWEAMEQYLEDCLDKPPSCPVESGHMYDHHEVDVVQEGTSVRGTLKVVDTSYAAAVHEGVTSRGFIRNWTRPGSGPKWIGSKALMYKRAYFSRVADKLYATLTRFGR